MLLPREYATPNNKAPVVRALAALLMVIGILAALTRIVTRLLSMRSLKLDDWSASGATILAIIEAVLVIIQGENGLGKHIDVLSADQISTILKSQYTADVFFILSLFTAKISSTRAIWHMAPRERRVLVLATEGIIAAWALSSVIACLFKCGLPHTWDYVHGRCINRAVFWMYVDILNIVTDLAITAIMIELFRKLQTSRSKKVLVIGVFSSRVFIIPAIACHIYYFSRVANSSDPTFDMWVPVVIKQVIQCMSIMAICIPYLKPFLDSLESGQMRTGDLRQITKGSTSRSKSGSSAQDRKGNSKDTKDNKNHSRGLSSITTLASNVSNRREMYEMADMERPAAGDKSTGTTTTATATAYGGGGSLWDEQSHTSQTVLVHQTWRVDVERRSIADDP